MKITRVPKGLKFKRYQKSTIKRISFRFGSTALSYGSFGLKILLHKRLTAKQLEAARRMISRGLRHREKL
jgi:large subunit ribosomal protein L16